VGIRAFITLQQYAHRYSRSRQLPTVTPLINTKIYNNIIYSTLSVHIFIRTIDKYVPRCSIGFRFFFRRRHAAVSFYNNMSLEDNTIIIDVCGILNMDLYTFSVGAYKL